MKGLIKPVLVAGFSFLVVAEVGAQDYIDVEAEREAERRAREAQLREQRDAPAQGQPVANDRAASEAGALLPASGTPAAIGNESPYGTGIRPYSGNTRVVTPVTAATPAQQQAPASSAAPGNMGDLVIMLQQLEADVRRLNGIVEEQGAALRRLEEQSLERYVDIDRRLAGGAAATNGAGQGSLTGGSMVPPTQPTGGNSDTAAQPGEETAYRAAYDQVRNRQFAAAVESFKAFLEQYPFGRFAPNSHYWLGELYLVAEPPDPELARQSFKLLLDQYPEDSKVPDALYKLGRVHFIKGNRDRSREYLERVIAEYSDDNHPAAQLARDFIAENF